MRRCAMVVVACVACGGRIEPPNLDEEPDAALDVHVPIAEAAPPIEAAPPTDAALEASLPISVSSAVLWLDSTYGVTTNGASVVMWNDRTAFGNGASASPYYAPTLVTQAIGKLPGVHFSSTAATAQTLEIADAKSLQWGTSDYFIVVVARFSNDPNGGLVSGAPNLFWKSTFASQTGAGVALWGNVPLSNGTVTSGLVLLEDATDYAKDTTAYHDGVARAYAARRVGGALQLRVNGVVTANESESSSVDVSAAGTPVTIGSIQTYFRLDGDLAEVIACESPTDGEIAALDAYLATKYSL